MVDRFEKIYEIAEREGWTVSHRYKSETSVYFLFSKFSPAGQDFNIEITVEDRPENECLIYDKVCDAIIIFWDRFDVCEETYLYLDNTGHGTNGAPRDMKDLYEDMEACEIMVADLWFALKGKKRPIIKPETYVYEVFESDAWHTRDSMTHKGAYLSLEDAVDAIMEHGEFDEEEDLDYIRKYLWQYRQTPNTGDINYEISVIEVGVWE